MCLLATWSSTHNVAGLFSRRPALYRSSWSAGIYRPGFQISRSHGSQAEHRSVAHVDSGRDRSPRAHPGVGAHVHGKGNQGEGWVVVIVRSSANVSLLGNDGVRSHADQRRVVYLRLIAHGNPVGTHQIPGSPHPGVGIKVTIRSQRGAEAAQEKSTPGVKGARRPAIQE
jgi:hypothetical protein